MSIVGVRLEQQKALYFCQCEREDLALYSRVLVEFDDGQRYPGVVAVRADQILDMPALPATPRPRVIGPSELELKSSAAHDTLALVAFLTAHTGRVSEVDLYEALHLSQLPLPEPPAARR